MSLYEKYTRALDALAAHEASANAPGFKDPEAWRVKRTGLFKEAKKAQQLYRLAEYKLLQSVERNIKK